MALASTVRVSIALLVPLINTVYIGTHDKNSLFQKGIEIITALGGAALLHDREYCVKTFKVIPNKEYPQKIWLDVFSSPRNR